MVFLIFENMSPNPIMLQKRKKLLSVIFGIISRKCFY